MFAYYPSFVLFDPPQVITSFIIHPFPNDQSYIMGMYTCIMFGYRCDVIMALFHIAPDQDMQEMNLYVFVEETHDHSLNECDRGIENQLFEIMLIQ